MPFVTRHGYRLHYRIDGRDAGPWLVFSNSLGTDLTMWDGQVEALSDRFRILRYDRRGHGHSDAPPGPYRIQDLGQDLLHLVDTLEIDKCHLCGLSIGGLVAQWLALHAPHRLDRLVVCSTAGRIGTPELWRARIHQVSSHGLASIVDATMQRWFTPAFAISAPRRVSRTADAFLATSQQGYTACCAALADSDLRDRLADIATPLLAIAGVDDPVTPPGDLDSIAGTVRDGRAVRIPGRHLCNVESADAFNAAITSFLARQAA